MSDSLSAHVRKGTGSREQGREQGAGRSVGYSRQGHQATQSGVSSCGNVDNDSGPRPLALLLEAVADQYATPRISQQRHEVIRTGERDSIAYPTRLAVLIRDVFRCGICGFSVRHAPAGLDHIRPWSAGGTDTTSNLRTTCQDCNQARSNRIDADEAPRTPATFWCDGCVGEALFAGHDQALWLFQPPHGHSCWFCRQDWWWSLYVRANVRPDDSPFAAAATPMHVEARCLHCKVLTDTRWSL